MNSKVIKLIIIIPIITVAITAIILNTTSKKEVLMEIKKTGTIEETPTGYKNFCYYRSEKTEKGIYDKTWIKLNIIGDKVTGEYQNIPADSDSKTGTFEGTIYQPNEKIIKKHADVWWNSRTKGIEIKEELAVEWNDESATVGLGEMIQRQDGIFVYRDKTKLIYTKPINQVDCDSLNEKLSVEQYIRENIGIIVPNKPVLGSTWYAILVVANPVSKTGEVIYDDGSVQQRANFTYTYEQTSQSISITTFEIKK